MHVTIPGKFHIILLIFNLQNDLLIQLWILLIFLLFEPTMVCQKFLQISGICRAIKTYDSLKNWKWFSIFFWFTQFFQTSSLNQCTLKNCKPLLRSLINDDILFIIRRNSIFLAHRCYHYVISFMLKSNIIKHRNIKKHH